MKKEDTRMDALMSIRSNIATQMEQIDIEPDHEYIDLLREECYMLGFKYPIRTQYDQDIVISNPKFDFYVLRDASRRHRYAMLKRAWNRINAKIHEVEQEEILDLINEAKTELNGYILPRYADPPKKKNHYHPIKWDVGQGSKNVEKYAKPKITARDFVDNYIKHYDSGSQMMHAECMGRKIPVPYETLIHMVEHFNAMQK